MFCGWSDQTVGPSVSLPLKTDHPGVVLVTGDLDDRKNNMVHSVNDAPLVSMVKDTDGPAILSDRPQNIYDP